MKTILVADTDSTICLYYAQELYEEGYDVITCSDPMELAASLKGKRPDVVLMDAGMAQGAEARPPEALGRGPGAVQVIGLQAGAGSGKDTEGKPVFNKGPVCEKGADLRNLKVIIRDLLGEEDSPSPSAPGFLRGRGKVPGVQMSLFDQEAGFRCVEEEADGRGLA